MEAEAAKYIGAGIACLALAGAGIGIGLIFSSYLQGALRNPSAASTIPLRISNRWVACLLPSRVSVLIVLVMLREFRYVFSVVFLLGCRITGSCSLINNHYCQTSAMQVYQALIFFNSQFGSNRYSGGIIAKAA